MLAKYKKMLFNTFNKEHKSTPTSFCLDFRQKLLWSILQTTFKNSSKQNNTNSPLQNERASYRQMVSVFTPEHPQQILRNCKPDTELKWTTLMRLMRHELKMLEYIKYKDGYWVITDRGRNYLHFAPKVLYQKIHVEYMEFVHTKRSKVKSSFDFFC